MILIIPAIVAWCMLAFKGIKLGRQGAIVVFRSWTDVAMTTALIVPVLSLIVVVPWLWTTVTATRRKRDLWVIVPAKISIGVLVVVCSAVAIICAITALSPKTEMPRRLVNGALSLAGAGIALGLFRTMRQLVAEAHLILGESATRAKST